MSGHKPLIVIAAAALTLLLAAVPALAASGDLWTTDGGDPGGYGWYDVSVETDADGSQLTRVSYQACDTSRDGRRILVNIYEDQEPVDFTVDKDGADNGCGATEVRHLDGQIAMRTCRQDWDMSHTDTRRPTDCSERVEIR